jgi:hypothetical protein
LAPEVAPDLAAVEWAVPPERAARLAPGPAAPVEDSAPPERQRVEEEWATAGSVAVEGLAAARELAGWEADMAVVVRREKALEAPVHPLTRRQVSVLR